ncbi:MAG: tetrahydrofolate dehydrogenase/cyclohydrolase catalytic domain-containing protein [Fusobacteriaceae bacterium]
MKQINLQDEIEKIFKENEERSENYSLENERKPFVAIIKTNPEDEPSERYTKKKMALLADYSCGSRAYNVESDDELIATIDHLNRNDLVTSIIVQAPFGKNITIPTQEVFDLVVPKKDIDRLHSKWYYDRDKKNLPLTAYGMYELIDRNFDKGANVLFYGNGLTTNKRLFLKMFDEGKHDCRIINSKTPSLSKTDMILWADLIVSATGIPEVLECVGKYVISPTIAKTENGFRGDLTHSLREHNFVHNVLGGIGKLTTSALIRRAFEDAKKQK